MILLTKVKTWHIVRLRRTLCTNYIIVNRSLVERKTRRKEQLIENNEWNVQQNNKTRT